MKLAANNPSYDSDKNSGFYISGKGWLSQNRIKIFKNSVPPRGVTNFTATFTAGKSSFISSGTCHMEYFKLVVDNEPGYGCFGHGGVFRTPLYRPFADRPGISSKF